MAWPAPGTSGTTGRPPVAIRIWRAVILRLPGCTTTVCGIDQLGAGLHGCDAGPLQAGAVEALEPRDLGVLVGDQRRPVERALLEAPAEPCRVLELVAEAAGVDQQLLGHAAADHAGAAEAVLLGDGHLGAVAGRNARRAHPAGAAADDEQVVVELAHVAVPPHAFALTDKVDEAGRTGNPRCPASVNGLRNAAGHGLGLPPTPAGR